MGAVIGGSVRSTSERPAERGSGLAALPVARKRPNAASGRRRVQVPCVSEEGHRRHNPPP